MFWQNAGHQWSGHLHVKIKQHHCVVLEKFASGGVVYEVFQTRLQLMGISGDGNRIVMEETRGSSTIEPLAEMMTCPCRAVTHRRHAAKGRRGSIGSVQRDRADHALHMINLSNFQSFWPSAETCATWMRNAKMTSHFSVHEALLSRWVLFDQDLYQWHADSSQLEREAVTCFGVGNTNPAREARSLKATPGRWSKVVSQLVRAKDYEGPGLNLLLEACPVIWACVMYAKEEESFGDEPEETTNLFLQGLANNERYSALVMQ